MIYEDDLLRERIHELIHQEGVSQREFAKSISRPSSNLSKILKGERQIPKGFAIDILRAYPRVKRDWLLFGEGSMYGEESTQAITLPSGTKPRLPRTMTDGHIQDYLTGAKRSLCEEKRIVTQFPDYDFTLFLKTDRMSPKYMRGDELAFKRTSIVEWGSDYLLDTAEGPKFKKIYPEKDSVRCVSYNRTEFPDFLIPRNLIYGFYKCVALMRLV